MKTVCTIWLADDDEDDCLIFGDVLAEFHQSPRLTYVKNGNELLNLLHASTALPDLIFLDVNMPVMDGITALEQIKADKRFKKVPVIMLSTSAQTVSVKKAFELGARLFVKKPDSFGTLKIILEKIFTLDINERPENAESRFLIQA